MNELDSKASKRCPRCRKTKSIDGFYINGQKRRRIDGFCKNCRAAMARDDQENRNACARAGYRRRHAHYVNYYRAYTKKHPDVGRVARKKYYRKNAEALKLFNALYRYVARTNSL